MSQYFWDEVTFLSIIKIYYYFKIILVICIEYLEEILTKDINKKCKAQQSLTRTWKRDEGAMLI